VEIDAYTFVLLRRGPRANDFADDELEELQRGHLVLAGPFRDQEDETKRGFGIYRTGLEETQRLTDQDPSVRAGRMAVEAMTWLTEKGTLD
jgi:uncharacterized protein YciI